MYYNSELMNNVKIIFFDIFEPNTSLCIAQAISKWSRMWQKKFRLDLLACLCLFHLNGNLRHLKWQKFHEFKTVSCLFKQQRPFHTDLQVRSRIKYFTKRGKTILSCLTYASQEWFDLTLTEKTISLDETLITAPSTPSHHQSYFARQHFSPGSTTENYQSAQQQTESISFRGIHFRNSIHPSNC